MRDNISTEQLNTLMRKIIVKNSSVGIHGAGVRDRKIALNTDWSVIYRSILSDGLHLFDSGCEQNGISGHIDMRGKIENISNSQTFRQAYKTFKDNMVCDIIIAIPETIKDNNDVIYYLGDYSNEVTGDRERFSFPLNRIKTLPKEFIVGCIVYENGKPENGVTYYQNENYYGLLSNDKKARLVDELTLQRAHMFKFTEDDYNRAKKIDKKYYREFCIKYKKYLNHKKALFDLKNELNMIIENEENNISVILTYLNNKIQELENSDNSDEFINMYKEMYDKFSLRLDDKEKHNTMSR